MKFGAVCWEHGLVHVLPEEDKGPFKQTLCGRVVPTQEELPVTGDVRVCTPCRRVQDLVLRGYSPARARDTLAGKGPRERKRGRHGSTKD